MEENTSSDEEQRQKIAAARKARWDEEILQSGHPYEPTPETIARRNEEIRRDEVAQHAKE